MLIYYKRALIDRLDKVFENTMLPPTFVAEQVHQIRQGFEAQMSKDASEQGESDSPDSSADAQPDDAELNSYLSLSPEAREAFVERLAKRRVRAGIFLMQYAERHDLKITREDLLEVVSTRYSIPASMHEMFLNYLEKDKKAMREIANIAIENIAVRHAIDRLCRLEPKEFETSEACAKFMVEYVSRGVDA
jgi:FKBP-type peptidyl-prolyl cis-trans isomerase (trigger factor)